MFIYWVKVLQTYMMVSELKVILEKRRIDYEGEELGFNEEWKPFYYNTWGYAKQEFLWIPFLNKNKKVLRSKEQYLRTLETNVTFIVGFGSVLKPCVLIKV